MGSAATHGSQMLRQLTSDGEAPLLCPVACQLRLRLMIFLPRLPHPFNGTMLVVMIQRMITKMMRNLMVTLLRLPYLPEQQKHFKHPVLQDCLLYTLLPRSLVSTDSLDQHLLSNLSKIK